MCTTVAKLIILEIKRCAPSCTAGACSGDVAVLTEAQGELGTVGRTYGNNEKCQWRIEIESGQVRCFLLLSLSDHNTSQPKSVLGPTYLIGAQCVFVL